MNLHPEEAEGIILGKADHGEHYQRLTLFTPQEGLVYCLYRLPKTKQATRPDLFDLIEPQLQASRKGSGIFLQGFRLLHRHQGLAENYNRLREATRFAVLLSRNLTHFEDLPEAWALSRKVLTAMESSRFPSVCYLKGLYLFVRMEGYPIREHWFELLSVRHQNIAGALLQSPLDALEAEPPETESIVNHLHIWLTEHTPITPPE